MSDRTASTGSVPLILHPAGLPSFLADEPSATDGVTRLREILARPAVELWNGGYAGASGAHLSTEELVWDLTWARTNPWDSGFGHCLHVSPTIDFPVLATATQAQNLRDDRPADDHASTPIVRCFGYVGYSRTAPAGGRHRLWFREHDGWKWLESRVLIVPGHHTPPRERDDDPEDCLHIVLAHRSFAEEETRTETPLQSVSLPTAEGFPDFHSTSESPQGTFFHSGIERDQLGYARRPAAVADIRKREAVSRDRTVRILRAAGGIDLPDTTRYAVDHGHDPFRNRELQGGVTGNLRLDTNSVGAVFSAGRIAGLVYNGAPLTPAVRSQGFLQTEKTTRYLESMNAAWFTGLRVRGVHEVAEIPGHVHLGVTTFAMDGLPGLVLNITGKGLNTASGVAAEEAVRHGVFEIPLWDFSDSSTERTGAVLDSSGRVREVPILPHLTNGLTDDESPLEWSVAAVGLRIDLPAASLWIITAHPGATLTVPLTLGVRPITGGYRVSWYPLGFERCTVPANPFCSRWSASYRILAADRRSFIPTMSRVEHDLTGEIDGFSCQGAFSGRSVPTR